MNRLFFKIFLWFWLALALVWAGFLIPTQLNQNQEIVQRFQALHYQRLLLSGRTALVVLNRGGPDALQEWMTSFEEGGALYPFVLDDEFSDIAGRELPAEALAAAKAAFDEDEVWMRLPTENRGRGALWVGRKYVTRRGDAFAVVQRLPSSSDLPPPSPWWAITRWVAVLLTSGLVCYWLARYLIAPVSTLGDAARRIAGGDLDVRVGERLGRRKDELADLGRDFDIMAERVGQLLATQRQLLTDISHELRSPLARLYVALGLARKGADSETDRALDRIERETERLNELIGQLLSLTRLEAGEPTAERQSVDLGALVAEIVADADFEAQGRERAVSLTRAQACTTEGFEELLRRAIENVVRNAVRYTSAGTRVETALDLRNANGRTEAVIQVRDHGPGVPEDKLEDLFRPFYRLDDARDRESGGTGLGLAISERAVRLHGGAISARNAEHGGLIVEITLPVTPAAGNE